MFILFFSDLTFKKGDVIILRKRVDQNWFYGELGGKSGFVPASFVQVVVPIPTHVPQCKALYDFQISSSEEKDCLTFGKVSFEMYIIFMNYYVSASPLKMRF